jgi:hypothetical protein
VITNSDIQSSPFAGFGGLFHTNSGSVNGCDAMCFDQSRLLGRQTNEQETTRRRRVLEQLDLVRSDREWQAYLHQLYDAHDKICHLTFDKNDELRGAGSHRNMGSQEIAIAEKYDDRMQAAKDTLAGVETRQAAVRQRFLGKPYALAFTDLQAMRMRSGFCSQARLNYPTTAF